MKNIYTFKTAEVNFSPETDSNLLFSLAFKVRFETWLYNESVTGPRRCSVRANRAFKNSVRDVGAVRLEFESR